MDILLKHILNMSTMFGGVDWNLFEIVPILRGATHSPDRAECFVLELSVQLLFHRIPSIISVLLWQGYDNVDAISMSHDENEGSRDEQFAFVQMIVFSLPLSLSHDGRRHDASIAMPPVSWTPIYVPVPALFVSIYEYISAPNVELY